MLFGDFCNAGADLNSGITLIEASNIKSDRYSHDCFVNNGDNKRVHYQLVF